MTLWRLNVQLQNDTVVYKNMSRIDYSCGVAEDHLGLWVSKWHYIIQVACHVVNRGHVPKQTASPKLAQQGLVHMTTQVAVHQELGLGKGHVCV